MKTGTAIIKVPSDLKKGEPFNIKFVIIHPMESGSRKDPKTGELVPAHHLTAIKITFNGKTVTEITTGTGVSANPTFGTSLRLNEPGELKIAYQDNLGGSWEKTAPVSF